MKDYHINIFYSEEDECYIADIPDLRFCSAFGDTPLLALESVQIAKEMWLESAREHGDPIPEPEYRPVIYHKMIPLPQQTALVASP
jgi:predicted RNase H-like HicB family nuclease